jgi:hypothetical protein
VMEIGPQPVLTAAALQAWPESSAAPRGEVDIKGKGVMRTWYLVGRRDEHAARSAVEHGAVAGRS